ncbi:MAG: hybrid sensor histidine kinase/response regulator [Sphingorhabdus sp.]
MASETINAALMDCALDGIIVSDAMGIVVGINPAAQDIFGWSAEEIVGLSMDRTIVPMQHRAAHKAGMERYLASRQPRVLGKRIELEGLRKNGATFPLELSIVETRLAGEHRFVAYVRDLSERKRLEAELASARTISQSVFDNITAAVSVLDRDDRVIMINNYAARAFGKTPAEMIGRPFTGYRTPEQNDIMQAISVEVFDHNRSVTRTHTFTIEETVYQAFTTFFPIPDADGTVNRVGIIAFDIGDQIRAEAERDSVRQQLLAFFNNSPTDMYLKKVEGPLVYCSPKLAEASGYTQQSIIGVTEDEFVHPKLLARVKEVDREIVEQGKVIVTEQMNPFIKRYQLGARFGIRNGDGKVTHIGGMTIDVHDRVLAQQELQKSRESVHQAEKLAALGQLLAGVAHELNNPLAIVVGRAAMLKDKLADTPHAAPLDKLRAAADRCSRIVKTFLAMARQSGPRRSLVEINELVESALDMTAYGLRTAGIEVRQDSTAKLPPTHADGDQIVQVLINLIINAQHAMEPAGGGTLCLSTRHDRKANRLIVEVADTGHGVPEEIATRIFDPFFTTKDVGAGTGMGLSVSKGMIEAQGGTLELAGNSSAGAMFRVAVPVRSAEEIIGEDTALSTMPTSNGHILIVDDETEIAEVLAECLEPLGLKCTIVNNGKAALDAVRKTRFDAVFTDVRMPGIDGLALYAALQAEQPALAKRLAFISGDVLHNDATRAAAMQGRPLIEKPFDPETVCAVARDLLGPGDEK